MKGVRDADSLLITSFQHIGWTNHAGGNERTLMPTLVSAGSDSSVDNDQLIRAEFDKLRVGFSAFPGEAYDDRFGRAHIADFSDTIVVVS